jgi:hypothetical protein
VDDAASRQSETLGSKRSWIIVVAIAVVGALVAVVVTALVARDDSASDPPTTASRALARLDENDGRAYVGTIENVADPTRLRRALRAEFRSDATRPERHRAARRARRCATRLRRSSGDARGRVVVLADATVGGRPVVVVGVTDRGRVVAFVADPETCTVVAAQSL